MIKPRHAGALALIGWYLMCAPYKNVCWFSDSKECLWPNDEAPLSQWRNTMSGAFDKAEDCDNAKMHSDNMYDPRGRHLSAICDCFATDDPRLAK